MEAGEREKTYYKFLKADGSGTYADYVYGEQYLPHKSEEGSWTPGEWLPAVKGSLVLCRRGYHVTDEAHLLAWGNARLFLVEIAGGDEADVLSDDDPGVENWKLCARSIRFMSEVETWNERMLRHFTADCLERIVPIVEKGSAEAAQFVREICSLVRELADGKITLGQFRTAWDIAWDIAWDTAWGTVWVKARVTAWDIAWATAWDTAWDTARDTAWDTAWDTARATAWDIAWATEREWQQARLMQYIRGEVTGSALEEAGVAV